MSDQRAQYERKLARQRQMEMMEAAASGTVPSMELDTALAESQLRSRNEEARLQAQQKQQQQHHRDSGMRTTQLFERPESIRPSVNLMDHDTGIYQEPTTLRQHVGSLFKGLLTRSEFDASPSDDYVGQTHRRRTSKGRPMGLYATTVACCKRNRGLCGGLIMVMFVTILTAATLSYIKTHPEKVLRQQNLERHVQIETLMIGKGMSHPDILQDPHSAEYHAIRWISYSDPMRLAINDPYLFQRYALAVFFYGSYFAFAKRAGIQQFKVEENVAEGVPNPGWIRSDGWLSGKGYCSWYGIECKAREIAGKSVQTYADNADIITLDMDNNAIMGSLPIALKGLDHLEYLDLHSNKLVGTFPYQIARIFNIQHLLLNGNDLTGTLPTWMGQLEQIVELRMGGNKFQGTIPTELNRLSHLKYLSLEYNQLTGELPSLINLKRLVNVNLDHNQLAGTIPDDYGFLKDLEVLRLSNNQLTGSFPVEINNIFGLKTLEIDHNALNGTLRDFLFQRLTNLVVVDVQHNQFTGTIPTPIGFLKHIEEVMFNNNNFSGPMPVWKEAYALRKIHIHENMVASFLPKGLCKLNNLEELWMNDNQFVGPVWPQWSNLTKLTSLALDHNKLTGFLPPSLQELTSLNSLRLQSNNFSSPMTPEICSLKSTAMLKSVVVDCTVVCDCCGLCH